MAEVKTVKRTITNSNPNLCHVSTVAGVVPVGPGATVEVEVDETVAKRLDKAIKNGTFSEGKKADEKTEGKTK